MHCGLASVRDCPGGWGPAQPSPAKPRISEEPRLPLPGRLAGTLALTHEAFCWAILAARLGLSQWGAWNSCLGVPVARGGHQLRSLVTGKGGPYGQIG